MSNRGGEEVVWALSEADGKELWETRSGRPPRQGMPQGREGPGCTPTVDGDRVYALGHGRRPRLPSGHGRQGRLAAEPDGRLRRQDAGVELPRVAADRRRQGRLHPRRQGRDCSWPSTRRPARRSGRQALRVPVALVALVALVAPPAAGGARGRSRRVWRLGRPTLRPSRSTSTGSRSTCSSPPRRSSGSRPRTASFSGATRSPPTCTASTALLRSTTTARSSPPRPTTRAAAW